MALTPQTLKMGRFLYSVLLGCGGIFSILLLIGLYLDFRRRRDEKRRAFGAVKLLNLRWPEPLTRTEWITIVFSEVLPSAFPHPNKFDCLYWIYTVEKNTKGDFLYVFHDGRCLSTRETMRLQDEARRLGPYLEHQMTALSGTGAVEPIAPMINALEPTHYYDYESDTHYLILYTRKLTEAESKSAMKVEDKQVVTFDDGDTMIIVRPDFNWQPGS